MLSGGKEGIRSTPGSLALIGTYDGMVRFRPDDFVAINNPLIPYFTNINIGGKDTVATDKLELDYNSPSFYIDYSVPTYAYQNTIYYRYKLENIDKDWIVVNDNLQRIFLVICLLEIIVFYCRPVLILTIGLVKQ